MKNMNHSNYTLKFSEITQIIGIFCLIFFVINPLSLFIFNIAEWDVDFWLPLSLVIVGIAVFLISLLVFFLLFNISRIFISILSILILVISISILLNDILFPLELDKLGLKSLYSEEPFLISFGESFLALGVFFLYLKFLKKNKFFLSSLLKIIFLIIFILISLSLFYFMDQQENKLNNTKVINNNSKLPNIYLIHLDGYQSDYFVKYLNETNSKSKFDGFTFYKNNVVNYPYTHPSILSYLTSTQYNGSTRKEWRDKLNESLFVRIKSNGYKVKYYGDESYKYLIDHDEHISTRDVLKTNNIHHPLIINFIQLSLAKNLPNYLTNESLSYGKEIGNKFFTFINPSLPSYIANIEKGYGANGSVLKLKSFIKDIEYQNAFGELTYVLVGFPHWPYAVDSNCEYKNPTNDNLSSDYYDQITCANSMLFKFFNKLKEHGKYDDSMIIVLSDHGSHALTQLVDPLNNSFENVKGSKKPYAPEMSHYSIESLEAHARGLLLIKRPYQNGKLIYSDMPTQLLDLFPTVMGLIGENNYIAEGIDIYNKTIPNDRKRYFNITGPLDSKYSTTNYKTFNVTYNEQEHLKLKENKDFKGDEVNIKDYLSEVKDKKFNEIRFFYFDLNGRITADHKSIFTKGIESFSHLGAWTNGRNIKIAFNTKSAKKKYYENLEFNLIGAFVSKINPKINVKIYANETFIGDMNFAFPTNPSTHNYQFSFKLPPEIIKSNSIVEIDLIIDGANSEFNMGTGEDKRLLGLSLKNIKIK